jgi:hypothetical protein
MPKTLGQLLHRMPKLTRPYVPVPFNVHKLELGNENISGRITVFPYPIQ